MGRARGSRVVTHRLGRHARGNRAAGRRLGRVCGGNTLTTLGDESLQVPEKSCIGLIMDGVELHNLRVILINRNLCLYRVREVEQ